MIVWPILEEAERAGRRLKLKREFIHYKRNIRSSRGNAKIRLKHPKRNIIYFRTSFSRNCRTTTGNGGIPMKDTYSGKRILVVEDDRFIRESIIEVLEEEGYLVHGVPNGQDAISFLKSTSPLPCLILLDLMMPVMNGWELQNQIKNDVRFKSIPIVVVTADVNAQKNADSVKVEGWVRKPIEIETLLKTVQAHCA